MIQADEQRAELLADVDYLLWLCKAGALPVITIVAERIRARLLAAPLAMEARAAALPEERSELRGESVPPAGRS